MKVKIKTHVHENGTTYFITDIGRSSLNRGFANDTVPKGNLETATSFSNRHDYSLVLNASTFNMELKELRGVIIHNGIVVQEEKNTINRPYLVIFKDGSIGHVPAEVSAEDMIKMDVTESFIGFFPIVLNKKDCFNQFEDLYPFSKDALNPQQIIFQKNNDIGFLTTNGRLDNEPGISVSQTIDLLIDNDVDFAYLLDGGGSTSLVVENETLNKLNTPQRSVADFIAVNNDANCLVEIINLQKEIDRLKNQLEVQRVDDIEKIKKTGHYWLARTAKGLPKNDNFSMSYIALSDGVGILTAYPFDDEDGTVYKNTRRSGKFRGWCKS